MVTQFGMSNLGPITYEQNGGSIFLGRDYLKEKNFSDQVALEIDKEVRTIVEECYERAKKVILENLDLLRTIAQYLIKVETLTKTDIDEIAATGHLEWYDKKEAEKKAIEEAKAKEEEEKKNASLNNEVVENPGEVASDEVPTENVETSESKDENKE